MTYSPWKLLSVADFLSQYSEAQSDHSIDATEANLQSNIVWQKRTVQDFFASCQWSLASTATETKEPFSPGLSVQSYFQNFQWDAPLKSLVASVPEPPAEPQPTFDVQNFSDLF